MGNIRFLFTVSERSLPGCGEQQYWLARSLQIKGEMRRNRAGSPIRCIHRVCPHRPHSSYVCLSMVRIAVVCSVQTQARGRSGIKPVQYAG